MENLSSIVEISPTILTGFREFVRADDKCSELLVQLQFLEFRERDMTELMTTEVANDQCKRPKLIVEHYVGKLRSFKTKANEVIMTFRSTSRWRRAWMTMTGELDELLKIGQGLVTTADQLQKEGLLFCEVCLRGVKLPVEKLIGETANGLRRDALNAIKARSRVIGIHGNYGAGKTNLMKWMNNDVFDEPDLYKYMFWATAPEGQTDTESVQDCIAEAMKFDFKDRDVVRRAGKLAKRLKDLGPGHIVLFLDNLKEPFQVHDVGLPVGYNEAEDFCCTLVFTASSENICNRMRCSAKFKMNLLQESEAQDLFLYEAGFTNHCTKICGNIQQIANDVAKQCARMPLVVTLIARSMTGIEDLSEWKNRLDELMGTVENMHSDEAMILGQLKFSFNCLTHDTLKDCFLLSATILTEEHHVSCEKLISSWMSERLIGKRSKDGATGEAYSNQGHAIINELHRLYLLEVLEVHGTKYVSMNKWIRKMAQSINDTRRQSGARQANCCSPRDKKRSLPL